MEITKDLVQYLENLGRLELSPEDEEKTQKALGDILGYFDQLNELRHRKRRYEGCGLKQRTRDKGRYDPRAEDL